MQNQLFRKNLIMAIFVVLLLLALPGWAVGKVEQEVSPTEQLAAARLLSKSLLRVEYTLRYDKGDSPEAGNWPERCPNCGSYHGSSEGQELVKDERPLEKAGYIVSDTEVLTTDVMVHPRFVEKIEVRFGEQTIAAKLKACYKTQKAILLELEKPLVGAVPMAFQPEKTEPYLLVSYKQLNGQWTTTVRTLSGLVTELENGYTFRSISAEGVITAADGSPVGMCMNDEIPIGDSWKGSPLQWPCYTAADIKDLQERLNQLAEETLLRATLHFRSPKAQSSSQRRFMMDDEKEENLTERNTIAILTGDKTVLVLANMKSDVTALLERIEIHPQQGPPVLAKFIGTLTDYGAIVAELAEPLKCTLEMSKQSILDYRNQLLPAVEVIIRGDERLAYISHQRIPAFQTGWRRQVYPELPGEDENLFLFDQELKLTMLPVIRRQKGQEQDRWNQPERTLTAIVYLNPVLADLANNIDQSNVPLSEAEENRLAWMGVELQKLSPELARVQKVSDLTNGGETGAMVSYVYPDSPASREDIVPGAILLRLHVEGIPQPLNVELDDESSYGQDFPWEHLDEIPEQYFDQIPSPWPNVQNSFNRSLTDIGFGKKYIAEFSLNGQLVKKEFIVTQSPAHYNSAPRYKSESLGLTVADLTYEVRRYFQKPQDDPGVIVAKVEPGGKAAVSGIKPYEIITHVNDLPIKSVQDFEQLIQEQKDLRLSVKRMTRGRVVKITTSGGPTP